LFKWTDVSETHSLSIIRVLIWWYTDDGDTFCLSKILVDFNHLTHLSAREGFIAFDCHESLKTVFRQFYWPGKMSRRISMVTDYEFWKCPCKCHSPLGPSGWWRSWLQGSRLFTCTLHVYDGYGIMY
jgi:hypothetical protein